LTISAPGMTSPATGACQLPPRGKVGDPCFSTCAANRNCSSTYTTSEPNPPISLCYEADGLFCDSSAIDRRCAPLPTLGAACSFECGSGLFCDSTSVCAARKIVGAVCAQSRECATGLACVSGFCGAPVIATQKACSGDYN
jgi:hypothetical protein